MMVVVTGCGMIAVTLGLAGNLAGLFFNDIAAEFQVGRGTVALTSTIYSICSAVVGMFAPTVVRRIGLRKTALIGSVIMVSTTVALSFVHSIFMMMLLNIIRGFSAGFIGMVTVNITINYWFHKNNSLMTSIAMSFSGIVGAILSPIVSQFITDHGWRNGYLLIAGIMVIMLLPSILLPISLKPETLHLAPYGESAQQTKTVSQAPAREIDQKAFMLLLCYTLMVPCATALSQHYLGISDSYGVAQAGAIMVSATMITNTGGKLLYGILSDKLGSRLTTSAYIVAITSALLMMATVRDYTLLLIAAALIGLSYSMGTVASSSIVREVFGPENYSKVYPKLSFCITLSSSSFTTLIGSAYDITGSYQFILLAMAALELCALLIIQLVFKKAAH